MSVSIRAIAGILLLGMLIPVSGCGQKGPLYLPDPPQSQQQK